MRKALLLVALLLLAGGPVLAQYGNPGDFIPGGYGSPSYQQWKAAIRGQIMAIETWSNLQWRRQATVGRYVRWGGAIVIGAALVYTALDYFYNELRRETGTPLDEWYAWLDISVGSGLGNYSAWVDGPYCIKVGGCKSDELVYRCGYAYRIAYYGYFPPGSVVAENRSTYGSWSNAYPQCTVDQARAWAQSDALSRAPTAWQSGEVIPVRPEYEQAVPSSSRDRFRSDLSWLQDVLVLRRERPELSQWLQQYPSAAQALRDQVIPRYLDDTPLGSPAAPYPGVQLEPVPNPNQWTDNPFTRPDIDTDGDGWPDWVEWYEANRRGVPWPDVINNPQVYPDPYGDPDGDGFPTWEEVAAGTNPYDPASYPQRRLGPATRIDTDGDGWPDEDEIKLGTDPRDPNSKPEGTPPEPEQRPEDAWPGGPPPGDLRPVELPQREALEKKNLPELKEEIWQSFEENVTQRWQEALQELRTTAAQRFPFAIVSSFRFSVAGDSAPCVFTVPIGPYQAQMDICSTPIWQAATAFRPILGVLVWMSAALLLIRRGLDVQR